MPQPGRAQSKNNYHILLSHIVEKAQHWTLSWASWIYCSRPLYFTSEINFNIFFHPLSPHLCHPSGDVLSCSKLPHLSHAWIRNFSLFCKWWRPFMFQTSSSLTCVNTQLLSLLQVVTSFHVPNFLISHMREYAWSLLYPSGDVLSHLKTSSSLTCVNTPGLSLLQAVTSLLVSRFFISHMREYAWYLSLSLSLASPSGDVLSRFKILYLSHAWIRLVSLFSKRWRPFSFQDSLSLTCVNTPGISLSLSLLKAVTFFHVSKFSISHMREHASSPSLSLSLSLSLFFDYIAFT
jgi:hypothetical protein